MISKCGNVSLIGISWGGAVCIIMAQMLEAENIGVSLTLLEGLPYAIQEWTNSLTQYGNINARLVLNYFNINSTVIINFYFIYPEYGKSVLKYLKQSNNQWIILGCQNISDRSRLEYRVTYGVEIEQCIEC